MHDQSGRFEVSLDGDDLGVKAIVAKALGVDLLKSVLVVISEFDVADLLGFLVVPVA